MYWKFFASVMISLILVAIIGVKNDAVPDVGAAIMFSIFGIFCAVYDRYGHKK